MKPFKFIMILFVMSSVIFLNRESFAWWSVSETNYMDMNMVMNQGNIGSTFYAGMDYGEDNLVPFGGGAGIADTDSFSCPSGTCYFDIILVRDLPYNDDNGAIQFQFNYSNGTPETWTDLHLEFWDSSFQNLLTSVPLLSYNSNEFSNSFFDGSIISFTSPLFDIAPWSGVSIDFTLNVDQMSDQFGLRQVATVGTIVPEPVSSTLIIIGGATLGFRRFRKKFKR